MLPSRSRGVGEYRELAADRSAGRESRVASCRQQPGDMSLAVVYMQRQQQGDRSDSFNSLKRALRPIGRSQEGEPTLPRKVQ